MSNFLSNIYQLNGKQIKLFGVLFYFLQYCFWLILGLSGTGFALAMLGMLGLFLTAGSMLWTIIYYFANRKHIPDASAQINPILTWIIFVIMILLQEFVWNSDTFPFTFLLLIGMSFYAVYSMIRFFMNLSRRKIKNHYVEKTEQPKTVTRNGIPKSRPVNIHPVYQQDLDQLAGHMRDLEQREASVSVFLDSFFADSTISKSRYLSVIRNAKHVLEANYENALRAAGMFGSGVPTPEREEIMDRYVSDSADVMNKIDKVINQLISVQQSDLLNDNDTLDGLLDDLAQTTSYYQRSNTI